MYGAIIGDLAGSIYEYDQIRKVKNIHMFKLIENDAFFSDDTILTIAILDAILNNKDYDYYLRKYISDYEDYKPNFYPYFRSSFSPGLIKWSKSNNVGNSHGNGAMMRISPIGYMFDTENDVFENARLATIPSHNSKEAIESATNIALIIFYLRQGLSREEILKKLKLKIQYIPFTSFNSTCENTIGNCLYVFFNSTSFEDAIRRTLFMGGDTDTNSAIVGSMAEALYGIDERLIIEANKHLPEQFIQILKKGRIKK